MKTCRKNEKIKPFINKYKWEGKPFPSEKDDWKKIEKSKFEKFEKKYLKNQKYCNVRDHCHYT